MSGLPRKWIIPIILSALISIQVSANPCSEAVEAALLAPYKLNTEPFQGFRFQWKHLSLLNELSAVLERDQISFDRYARDRWEQLASENRNFSSGKEFEALASASASLASVIHLLNSKVHQPSYLMDRLKDALREFDRTFGSNARFLSGDRTEFLKDYGLAFDKRLSSFFVHTLRSYTRNPEHVQFVGVSLSEAATFWSVEAEVLKRESLNLLKSGATRELAILESLIALAELQNQIFLSERMLAVLIYEGADHNTKMSAAFQAQRVIVDAAASWLEKLARISPS